MAGETDRDPVSNAPDAGEGEAAAKPQPAADKPVAEKPAAEKLSPEVLQPIFKKYFPADRYTLLTLKPEA